MSEPLASAPRAVQGSSVGVRWAVGVGAAAIVAIGGVLILLLTQATNNQELYEQNYQRLFLLNIGVAALLLAVTGWITWRLLWRLRQGRFGSRLLVKLAAIFALVGLLPGALIYVVSYQFVSRSIESWFDVKVEGALDAGLNLGRATLDTLAADLGSKTRNAARELADAGEGASPLMLERLREQLPANDILLWSGAGQLLASAGESRFALNPERPSTAQLRQLRTQRVITQIEGLDDVGAVPGGGSASVPNTTASPGGGPPSPPAARVRVWALVNASGFGINTEPRVLQVTQALAPALVANAIAVQEAHREYQERALARSGLRRMYIGTLTLSLFLAVFSAVLLAVVLGNQLARPLLVLADGVREVAAGDLRPKAALQTRDELGGLTRSFADMTQQLSDARAAVQHSMQEVDNARGNLQTILDNQTSGVMVLSASGLVVSANPGATRILRAPLAAWLGQRFDQVPGLGDFAHRVGQQFDAFLSEQSLHGLDHWQQAFDLQFDDRVGSHASGGGLSLAGSMHHNAINLVARGAVLPDTASSGQRLLVFDDISEVVSAQRAQAWGEVARRLAHEIKNPLTPIQLSAERLEMKLGGKLEGTDQALLTKSVKTIVDQVDAMKRLVNEFRDYARLPAAELKPVDLNALLADVLALYQDEALTQSEGEGVATLAPPAIHTELDPACPPIAGDAQQLRQVIHNLLQNAQDATEAARDAQLPRQAYEVRVITRYNATNQRVRLTVRDSGTGFAEHILQRAFEPYVTTKAKGTGLGLAVVKKIADEHGARIDLTNRSDDAGGAKQTHGAQVSLSFAVASARQVSAERA